MTKAELIKKFLENRCTAEEAKIAMQYLVEEPDILDETLSSTEWDEIDPSLIIPPDMEPAMRSAVFAKTRPTVITMAKTALRVAAVVMGIAVGLLAWYQSTKQASVASQLVETENLPKTTTVTNNTNTNKELLLPDNSVVSLYPGATLEYNLPFVARDIQLKGKAIFTVTKNTSSRFVVYSGTVSTTALGTRFLVDLSDDDKKVNVKLFEGKVVVQQNESTLSSARTYLEAGQQCFVDVDKMIVKVESLFSSRPIAKKQGSRNSRASNTRPGEQVAGRLQFVKTPLDEVLANLQAVYNQPIHFNKADIEGRHFTGSFTSNDSLSVILKMISVMNEMQVADNDGVIMVTKAGPTYLQLPDDASFPDPSSAKKLALAENMQLDGIAPPSHEVKAKEPLTAVTPMIVSDENVTMYTRVPLIHLLARLQTQTKRKILFNQEELAKINFTGAIPFDDGVRNILAMICRINGLTLTVKNRSYIISKSQ